MWPGGRPALANGAVVVSSFAPEPSPVSPSSVQSALPAGTVTFLFTDIEGSTERWERDRAAMATAVERHDVLIRAAIEAHGGHAFKTVGDAFCAAFQAAPAAVAAAVSAQHALAAADWQAVDGLRVRMALHSGDADERGGDYFGPPVNRVARLLAAGHGGQVLLSAATAHLVQGQLPADTVLDDLGEHRLKDLAQPEHVYQLVAAGIGDTFAPLRTLDVLPNNLPLQLTSFVGREREVAEITGMLATSRLVTLVGPGGIGKSRISTKVAAQLLDGFRDGTWLVELAPLGEGSLVVPALANALAITIPPKEDPKNALIVRLRSKQALLILDNCEHLMHATADIASAIIRNCPNVTILASSRERLGITGELVYRVASLPVPPANASLTAGDARTYGAVELFATRAVAVDNRFALTDGNAPVVADICRRLDGIALAIELAAPRVKALSVEQLRTRLDERFKILTGGRRDALPRQQTLRALIDWSYDLLGEKERAVLRRLAIFVDGCTLDAAAAIACDDAIEEWEALDLITSLVDKSLVVAEPGPAEMRYRLLESTRQYALEKLEDAGERDAIGRRHATFFAALVVNTFEQAQQTLDDGAWHGIVTELDNIRAALAWGERYDVPLAVRIAGKVPWADVGRAAEGWLVIERLDAIADDGTSPAERAFLLLVGARCSDNLGDRARARRLSERAMTLAKESGDAFLIASVLVWDVTTSIETLTPADAEAVAAKVERARATAAGTPSRRLQSVIDNADLLGSMFAGNRDRAHAVAQSIHGRIKRGDGRAFLTFRLNFAELEFGSGHWERAVELIEEIADELDTIRDRDLVRLTYTNLAAYRVACGELAKARDAVRRALRGAPATESATPVIAFALQHLAHILALEGSYDAAARFAGFSESTLQVHGTKNDYTEQRAKDELDAILRERLDEAHRLRLAADGSTMTLDEAVEAALLA